MPIIINLDVMLAKRKIKLNELSESVGITIYNGQLFMPVCQRL